MSLFDSLGLGLAVFGTVDAIQSDAFRIWVVKTFVDVAVEDCNY